MCFKYRIEEQNIFRAASFFVAILVQLPFDRVLYEIDGHVDLIVSTGNGDHSVIIFWRTVSNTSARATTDFIQSRSGMSDNVTEIFGR